jgi:site-specific DNA-methyltransferase (adenine-specific)
MLKINYIHHSDAKKGIDNLQDNSIDLIVTSPPYWQKRDYNAQGQIGLESDFNEYLQRLVNVFISALPKLKNSASVWVNIADTYAGSQSRGKDFEATGVPTKYSRKTAVPKSSVKSRSQIGIPFRFATMMIDNGYILRNTIIWKKPNPTPGGSADFRKFSNDFEYLFWFVKSGKYKFNSQSEPLKNSTLKRAKSISNSVKMRSGVYQGYSPEKLNKYYDKLNSGEITTKNKRTTWDEIEYSENEKNFYSNIWEVATKSFKGEHFAVYPEQLVQTPILSCSDKNDIVLDPFIGAGTTAVVSKKLGRNYIGIDINKDFIDIANKRLNNTTLKGIDLKNSLKEIAEFEKKRKKQILKTSSLLIAETYLLKQ